MNAANHFNSFSKPNINFKQTEYQLSLLFIKFKLIFSLFKIDIYFAEIVEMV